MFLITEIIINDYYIIINSSRVTEFPWLLIIFLIKIYTFLFISPLIINFNWESNLLEQILCILWGELMLMLFELNFWNSPKLMKINLCNYQCHVYKFQMLRWLDLNSGVCDLAQFLHLVGLCLTQKSPEFRESLE